MVISYLQGQQEGGKVELLGSVTIRIQSSFAFVLPNNVFLIFLLDKTMHGNVQDDLQKTPF